MARKKKRRNYVIKTTVDDIEFASETEAVFYKLFKRMENITILDIQKTFLLYPPFQYCGFNKKYEIVKRSFSKMVYTPDFVIEIEGIDKPIAVEIKGHARPIYKMRKKLFIRKYSDTYYFIELKRKHLKEFEEKFGGE